MGWFAYGWNLLMEARDKCYYWMVRLFIHRILLVDVEKSEISVVFFNKNDEFSYPKKNIIVLFKQKVGKECISFVSKCLKRMYCFYWIVTVSFLFFYKVLVV